MFFFVLFCVEITFLYLCKMELKEKKKELRKLIRERKKQLSLSEKQKEGKKKMKKLGSVELPSEAFLSILKID